MTDWLDKQYQRDVAAPLTLTTPKFNIGQLLKDEDGDIVQVIGLEYRFPDPKKEDFDWFYAIWDVSLGVVLGMEEHLLSTYTLVKS